MGVFWLILATLMWSFVGIFVKYASFMVDSWIITFCRFFFGIVFLGMILYWQDRRIVLHWKTPWIWYGAIAKLCNYIFENMAIAIGYAYGNIVVMPAQTVVLMAISFFYFKEKINGAHLIAAAACIVGVGLVGWNGASLDELFGHNALLTGLFVLAAIGASLHVVSQKMLIKHYKTGEMNFSVFAIASLLAFVPLPVVSEGVGAFEWIGLFSLIMLGFITGVSFYISAHALKTVPLSLASIIMNSSVLFTLLWAWLFFQEPITGYVIAGAFLFITGMLILNFAARRNAG